MVLAIRGAAGSGKSVFASTLAHAGLGRLCYFDVERKGRLLPGSDGTIFDAIEIEQPGELPDFIEWALNGEGREQHYGCYVLDSWGMYFAGRHAELLAAVREQTGNPTAQPNADALIADQMLYQSVLRRLCIESGASIVVTDTIGARGKGDQEENEMGRVLPMTMGGLEYFVDVMLEIEVRVEGFEMVRIARVVKTNNPLLPLGTEFRNPVFSDLLQYSPTAPSSLPVTPTLPVHPTVPSPIVPTLAALKALAVAKGISIAQLNQAARHYCRGVALEGLSPSDLTTLYERLQQKEVKAVTQSSATSKGDPLP